MQRAVSRTQKTGSAPPRRPLRVVIADDNRDYVLTTQVLLRLEGYETKACYSGSEVYDCVKEFDADVVLLDIRMPGMSGWAVAEQIRARIPGKRPLLIGITGERITTSDRILSEMRGLDYHLNKPLDIKALVALIETARHPG